MKQKNKQNIWIKILLFFTAFIVLIIIGNIAIKSLVEKKIRAAFNQFQPYIKTDFKTIHVNLFDASINFDSITILYQPNLQLQNKHSIYFDAISVNGINFFKLVSGKNFSAASLKLNEGKINLNKQLLSNKDSLPTSLFKSVKLPFKDISWGLIEVKNVNIYESDSTHQTSLLNANFILNNVDLDDVDSSFSTNKIQFENVRCELNKINYNLLNYQSIKIKKLAVNSKDSSLRIDSLQLIPQLGKFETGNRSHQQVDYINAVVASISAKQIDVKKLIDNKFYAQQLDINNSKVYCFRDRRLPREIKKQPLPLDYLKQIPLDVRIQHFNINNFSVRSEEFPKEGNQSGYIEISKTFIHVTPLINRPILSDKKFITADVKGSIMHAGIIEAHINLSLINGNQTIKGFIENLDLPAMNPSAENLGKFSVKSGVLNKLDFDFIATDKKATGQIVGVYHDLVIDRLKIDKNGKFKKAKLPSFLLNKIIIPKNKDASLPVKKRTGKIDYNRDPTRLVTFYLLKALLDGIRDSFAFGFVLPQ